MPRCTTSSCAWRVEATVGEIVADRPGTLLPDPGPPCCVCHRVGEIAILCAARGGTGPVAEIGGATMAGTNCGRYRPLLARMLEALQPELAEAAEGTTSQLGEGLALILIGEAVAAPRSAKQRVSQTARQAVSGMEWIAASS